MVTNLIGNHKGGVIKGSKPTGWDGDVLIKFGKDAHFPVLSPLGGMATS